MAAVNRLTFWPAVYI